MENDLTKNCIRIEKNIEATSFSVGGKSCHRFRFISRKLRNSSPTPFPFWLPSFAYSFTNPALFHFLVGSFSSPLLSSKSPTLSNVTFTGLIWNKCLLDSILEISVSKIFFYKLLIWLCLSRSVIFKNAT